MIKLSYSCREIVLDLESTLSDGSQMPASCYCDLACLVFADWLFPLHHHQLSCYTWSFPPATGTPFRRLDLFYQQSDHFPFLEIFPDLRRVARLNFRSLIAVTRLVLPMLSISLSCLDLCFVFCVTMLVCQALSLIPNE